MVRRVLVAGQLLERSRFPLSLMPGRADQPRARRARHRIAGAVLDAAMETTLSFADMAAAVVGAWLVLALGAWIRYRVDEAAAPGSP